jgi:hypothetical protein
MGGDPAHDNEAAEDEQPGVSIMAFTIGRASPLMKRTISIRVNPTIAPKRWT